MEYLQWVKGSVVVACGFMIALLSSAVHSQNSVVVIPMSGDDLQPLANIVTVAKQNGDFSDPIAAVDSITNASAANPYLIVIAPGTYTLAARLVLKDHVSITGSGAEATKLVGDTASTDLNAASALVEVAESTRLANLSITNSASSGNVATGVAVPASTTATVSGVAIAVDGGSNANVGMVVEAGAAATVAGGTITTDDNVNNIDFGIYAVATNNSVIASDLQISSSFAISSGGSGSIALCGFVVVLPDEVLDSSCGLAPF